MSHAKPPAANDKVPMVTPGGVSCEHPTSESIPGLELGSLLGEGLFSRVYRAKTTTPEGYEEVVAVKLWKPGAQAHLCSKPSGSTALQLKHVNVVRRIDEGVTLGGTPYLVMEYARGQTLRALLSHGPIEVSRAISISRQLARALVALHGAHQFHGDLKPNHILVVDDEHHDDLIKLCDIGAKSLEWVEANVDEATWIQRSAYVAPEQLHTDAVTPRSDLYSAGVVLFEMLTGSVPRVGEPATKLVASLPRYVPRALKDVVLRLLQKEPALRFSSAEQWLTALDQVDGRNQEDDEHFSSSPRSAFIAGGLSRTAPPGSVRAASSLRKAPWGLDAGGFRLWAVACGLAAVGAAGIVSFRMYTHRAPSATNLAAQQTIGHSTNAQAPSPQSPAELLLIGPEARTSEQWLTLCTHYADAGLWAQAESTLEQAVRHSPTFIRESQSSLLARRLGERGTQVLKRLELDASLPREARQWAHNNQSQ